MANENEIVDNVCEEMRNDWAQLYFANGARKRNGKYSDVCVIETEKVANRILAAHKREIAEQASVNEAQAAQLRDALNECEELKREIAAYHGERKGLLKANEHFAADNTRLRGEVENLKWKVENYAQVVAAKDAEIARLKACRDGECERIRLDAEPCEGCHVQVASDEITKLRALVKDLSVALNESCDCRSRCDGCDMADESKFDCTEKKYRALVLKAREVCK